jgi:hypothetical protein
MISILVAMALSTAAEPGGADVAAAKAWVALVDGQRWDESWGAAGTLFKSQVPQPRWAGTVRPVREPLGTVVGRSVKTVSKTNSLPGAPDGEYEIVQFQTSFANKRDATETVILVHEASGWKVDGYFIR